MIWNASIVLCNWIDQHIDTKNTNVLELGAGCGLPGIHCALNGANETFLTDLEEELHYPTSLTAEFNIKIKPLKWGRDNSVIFKNECGHLFDLVLASDCVSTDVYGRSSWHFLCDTVDELLSPNGRLLVCSVRRPNDGLEEFLQLLKETLAHIELVSTDGDVEIHECRRFKLL